MRTEDIIKQELSKVKNKKEQGDSIYICCPFHREKTPSFGINLNPNHKRVPLGFGHCFGCGTKKNWNQIAKALGLKELSNMKSDGTFKQEYVAPLSDKVKKELFENENGLSLQDIEKEWGCVLSYPIEKTETWRDINGNLLRKIGCWVSVDEYDNKCLLMPVTIDGTIVGAQKALWEKSVKKKIPSYLNYTGEWIKEEGLFPYDYVEKLIRKTNRKYVVLVEGARDALRLLEKGYPALAILGTNNWSRKKLDLINLLNIDFVVIMMDADDPGVAARREIKELIKNKIETKVVKLDKIQYNIQGKFEKKDAWDPGNIPEKYLNKILKKLDNV